MLRYDQLYLTSYRILYNELSQFTNLIDQVLIFRDSSTGTFHHVCHSAQFHFKMVTMAVLAISSADMANDKLKIYLLT